MDDTETQLLPDNPFSPMGRYEIELYNAIMQPRWTQTPQPDRDVTPKLQTPLNYPPAYPGGRGRYLAPADTDLSHPPYSRQLNDDGSGGIYGAEPGNIGTRPTFHWIPQPLELPDARPDLLHQTGAKALLMDSTSPTPAAPVAAPPPAADTPAPPAAGSLDTGNDPITPIMRNFLNGVAGPESGGRYDIRYGGAAGPQYFNGYDAHPNVVSKIPGTDTTSTAAGKYQFLQSTWEPVAKALGLKDFSPDSQDRGAAYLATSVYKRVTGRDLEADLQDPARHSSISTALHSQWPTLTGRNIGIAMGATPAAPPTMVASAAPAIPQAAAPAQIDPFAQLRALNRLQMLGQMTQPQQAKAASVYNPGGNTAAILQAGNIGQPANPMQTMMQIARMRNPLYSYNG